MEKMKKYIKEHDKLHAIVRCLMNINDPHLYKLLQGYYEDYEEADTLLIEHPGQKFPNSLVYDISDLEGTVGFCAELLHLLYKLKFAESIKAEPRVVWGSKPNKSFYYEPQMDAITTNIFEYYFNPISDLSNYPVQDFKNVISATAHHIFIYQNIFRNPYEIRDDQLAILSEQYKKNIHLNEAAKKFIDDGLEAIIKNRRVLGVHVRGTDMCIGYTRHPVFISSQEYLDKTKIVFDLGQYDRVFLATDDINALKLFQQEFKDKLLCYTDVFRTGNQIGPLATPSDRPLHHYMLGLEVLRDVYTLANCDSLVCGLSQVSIAARYVNIALERKFKEVVILSHGMNAKDSTVAKKRKFREMLNLVRRS